MARDRHFPPNFPKILAAKGHDPHSLPRFPHSARYYSTGRTWSTSAKVSVAPVFGISQRPTPHRGHALIVNYTATSYHWGCYATSVALHESLTRAGYAVMTSPVEVTHAISTTPTSADDLQSEAFQSTFERGNGLLCQLMRDCEMVVINGEGTLHRDHAGSRNLLAIAYIAATRYRRPVHMVNHSCFPNGDNQHASDEVEALYRLALGACTTRAAREPLTAAHYKRWGMPVQQSFDCLPLWLETYFPRLRHKAPPNLRILIAGGVSWYEAVSEAFASALVSLDKSATFGFLGGSYRRDPPEDMRTMNALKPLMPSLAYLTPKTTDDWLREIASTTLLVTGRFHHAVAAAALGTPFVSMASNTPKTDGVCEFLALPKPLDPYSANFRDEAASAVSQALSGSNCKTNAQQQLQVRALAKVNLCWEA